MPLVVLGMISAVLLVLEPAQEPLFVRLGESPGDLLGQSLAALGDHDGDGQADFVVGLPGDNPVGPGSGGAKVLSGAAGHELLNLIGRASGDRFGASVASAGDVDCDAVADILVGAPGASTDARSAGRAYLFSGQTAEVIFTFEGSGLDAELGSAVAGAGDIDGDGIPEVAIGAPGASHAGAGSGTVHVHAGADASILYTFDGSAPHDRFGCSLAGGGDVEGDGVPDLVVGAFQPRGQGPGYARVLAGADASILYTFGGQEPGDGFGLSVAVLGDLNADGCAEVLVGAPHSDENGYMAGSAWLFSGRDGQPIESFLGDASGDRFGIAVTALGDLDGDGTGDFAVGAHQPRLPLPGYVRIFSGSDLRELTTLVGAAAGHQFGVSTAGLPHRSGAVSIAVGAWADRTKGVWTGSVTVFGWRQ